MRIIVCSDTHRDCFVLRQIIEKHRHDADAFFHLGDGLREFEAVTDALAGKDVCCVRGNCDVGSIERDVAFYGAGDYKILLTHGHTCHVKYGLDELIRLARENHAHIALYGHTHKNFTTYCDGIYLMNPGSPSCPRGGTKASYGIVDVTKAGIVTNIVAL